MEESLWDLVFGHWEIQGEGAFKSFDWFAVFVFCICGKAEGNAQIKVKRIQKYKLLAFGFITKTK